MKSSLLRRDEDENAMIPNWLLYPPGIMCSRSLKILGIDISDNFSSRNAFRDLRLRAHRHYECYGRKDSAVVHYSTSSTDPSSSRNWCTPPAYATVSPRLDPSGSASTCCWIGRCGTVTTVHMICRHSKNCARQAINNCFAKQLLVQIMFFTDFYPSNIALLLSHELRQWFTPAAELSYSLVWLQFLLECYTETYIRQCCSYFVLFNMFFTV